MLTIPFFLRVVFSRNKPHDLFFFPDQHNVVFLTHFLNRDVVFVIFHLFRWNRCSIGIDAFHGVTFPLTRNDLCTMFILTNLYALPTLRHAPEILIVKIQFRFNHRFLDAKEPIAPVLICPEDVACGVNRGSKFWLSHAMRAGHWREPPSVFFFPCRERLCARAFCLCATANGGRKCGTNALFVVHAAEKFRQFLSPALMPRLEGIMRLLNDVDHLPPILNVISERQHGITSLSGGLDLSLRADGSQLFMHPKNASLFQGLFKGHFLMRAFTFPKHLWEKSVDLDRPLSLKEGQAPQHVLHVRIARRLKATLHVFPCILNEINVPFFVVVVVSFGQDSLNVDLQILGSGSTRLREGVRERVQSASHDLR